VAAAVCGGGVSDFQMSRMMRPMSIEAVAGNNPVSHVGKLLSEAVTLY
jgi:S-adenosylmethionine synthetase